MATPDLSLFPASPMMTGLPPLPVDLLPSAPTKSWTEILDEEAADPGIIVPPGGDLPDVPPVKIDGTDDFTEVDPSEELIEEYEKQDFSAAPQTVYLFDITRRTHVALTADPAAPFTHEFIGGLWAGLESRHYDGYGYGVGLVPVPLKFMEAYEVSWERPYTPVADELTFLPTGRVDSIPGLKLTLEYRFGHINKLTYKATKAEIQAFLKAKNSPAKVILVRGNDSSYAADGSHKSGRAIMDSHKPADGYGTTVRPVFPVIPYEPKETYNERNDAALALYTQLVGEADAKIAADNESSKARGIARDAEIKKYQAIKELPTYHAYFFFTADFPTAVNSVREYFAMTQAEMVAGPIFDANGDLEIV